ncbi:hypothetical protein OF83DRAFT_910148 [Amylostereum chailletii]|nr:hypothetical protein OF83DRAFT_910148 [Amylostereum chailletii]
MFLSDHESDDDDGALEISTPSSRSRSSSSSRTRANPPTPPYPSHPVIADTFSRPILVRTNSSDKEHMTIAPIAPTTLKTTGVGNDSFPHNATNATVNLVYVPNGYTNNVISPSGMKRRGSSEDVYRHREARFSVEGGSSSSSSSRSPSTNTGDRVSSPPVPSAEALPLPAPTQYGHRPSLEPPSPGGGRFLSAARHSSLVESPMGMGEHADDVYEYFGAAARPQAARFGLGLGVDADVGMDDDMDVQEVETYVLPVASTPVAAVDGHKPARTRSGDMPEVVVNDENGAIEERRESRETSRSRSRSRSKSRSRSHSRTPSPSEMVTSIIEQGGRELPGDTSISASVPVPSVQPGSHRDLPHNASADSALLSPPPPRGRIPGTATPPVGRSMSGSDSDRGRSASRGALSDRERSASRGGTGSPLGSVSPTGSAIGLQYAVYTQGRGGIKRPASGSDGEGSARGRAGRKAGEASVSPPAESRSAGGPSSSSGSSSAPSTSSPRSSGEVSRPSLTIPKIPDAIVEEDETLRSAGATPHATTFSNLSSSRPESINVATAPTSTPASPPGKPPTSLPPPPPPTATLAGAKGAGPGSPTAGGKRQAGPASPTSPREREDSMVGRAVSSAKGFLGSIWP